MTATQTEKNTVTDPDTLERAGWLILDAAEYAREVESGGDTPADELVRRSVRRRLRRRTRYLRNRGDPLGVARKVNEMLDQIGP